MEFGQKEPPLEENIGKKQANPDEVSSEACVGEIHLGAECGCGCLCVLCLYYIIGLFQLGDINWKTEWWYVPVYALGPFFWPIVVAWWSGMRVIQVLLALLSLWLYACILKQMFKPKSCKIFFMAAVGLIVLVLLAVGGCFASVARGLKGVC